MKRTKSASWIMAGLNVFAFALLIFIRNADSAAGNVLFIICLALLAVDLLWAAFSKNCLGLWLIPAEIALVLLCHYPRQFASVDIHNLSGASMLADCAAFAMPLAAGLFFALDALGVGRAWKDPRFLRPLKRLLAPVLLIGLFFFALLGYDNMHNFGYSVHEFTTTRADYLLIALIFMISCLFLRLFWEAREDGWKDHLWRHLSMLTIFAVLAGYGSFGLLRGYLAFNKDAAAAEEEYTAMFGEPSKNYAGDVRQVPMSLPALFFGIRNGKNYEVMSDVAYCTIPEDEGIFAGMRLAYDIYLPTGPDAHRSVVVMLHGSGGDKSKTDNPQRSRYLASKGYTVFELQVGDRSERDTGFPEGADTDWEFMLRNIDRFFAYAAAHESVNANFDSVFLMGSSMGGFLTTDYIYRYEHKYQDHGVNIRGIVPLYGVISEAEIRKDSLPAFIYTGDHDGYVNVWDIYGLREKYSEAGNPNALALTVSFGGHSCDIEFSSRPGQLQLYYLERFFGQLR